MIVIMAPIHVFAREKEHIKKKAKKEGKSMNSIMRELIQEDMKKVKK